MTKSKIEWTDRVWNPTTGCSKVSQGCKNCYAEVMHKRLMKMKPDKYAKPFLDGAYSHIDTLTIPATWKKPALIFVNSMSDLFHEDISFEFIAAVFSVMSDIDRHTYQVLTKRPKRMVEFFEWKSAQLGFDWQPSDNVWLGVSVEDYGTMLERIPYLFQCRAAVRFLSCEPLLGPLNIMYDYPVGKGSVPWGALIDWVIIGGESGHHARPMNPFHVMDLIKQCQKVQIPVYFKQWGEWAPNNQSFTEIDFSKSNIKYKDLFADGMQYFKVGKNRSGRIFGGKEYTEFPIGYLKQVKEPQFKHLKFQNDESLQEWLKSNASYIIDLVDFGQDMQRIWVHSSGEILHADFQSSIYSGRFIDTKKINPESNLHIWKNESGGFIEYGKLKVQILTTNTKAK